MPISPDPTERFIELLRSDIQQFNSMADNLEHLIPYLAGQHQKALAQATADGRRAQAKEYQALINTRLSCSRAVQFRKSHVAPRAKAAEPNQNLLQPPPHLGQSRTRSFF